MPYALCSLFLMSYASLCCMPYASSAAATDFDDQQVYICLMPYASLFLMSYASLCRMPYASSAAATDFDDQQVYMCPHSAVYCYICVLILLHVPIYVC